MTGKFFDELESGSPTPPDVGVKSKGKEQR